MAIDYSGFAIPKGTPRVLERRTKRLSDAEAERECRKQVKALYGSKCVIPGCREPGIHLHHVVYRSKSRRLKYEPTNRRPVCAGHHALIHAGTIHLRFDEQSELIVEGPKDILSFKL